MLRKLLCAVVVLVICAGVSLADEVKGKIKKIDAEKNTITVTDKDGKDVTLTLTDKAEVLDTKGKAIEGGLKAKIFQKTGQPVTVTYEKEKASKVKLES